MKKLLLSLSLLFAYSVNSQNIDVSELEINFLGDSRPKNLTKGLTKIYFSADDGTHMEELWVYDSVTNTTHMVKDIGNGNSGTYNSVFLTIGDILYFTINVGTQLWRSDGTEDGTYLVKHINSNFWSSNTISSLFNYNGNLVFSANDDITGHELWISNGTTDGTTLLKDIRIGANTNSFPGNFTVCNGSLYFTADNGTNGVEVWKSDGTTAGTMLLKDINPGSGSGVYNTRFMVFDNHIYFYAYTAANGYELWKSDGTEAGTQLFKDIAVGINSSNSSLIGFAADNYFVFQVDLPTLGREFWVSDGTAAGTVLLKDINSSGNGIPVEPQFAKFNNKIYFNAFTTANGEELWETDGTTAGTQLVKDIKLGATSSFITKLTATSNYLIFTARGGTATTNSIWKSNGTDAGTEQLKDMDVTQINDLSFVELNNLVYFPGYNVSNGIELWSTDGTTVNTKIFKDINHGYGGVFNLNDVAELNNRLIYTGMSGYTPAVSDGTINNTMILNNAYAGYNGFSSDQVTALYTKAGNNVFFKATTPGYGFEIWKTDGTIAGTNMVKDVRPGSASSLTDYPLFMVYNNIFYFKANDGTHAEELWRSDGTEVGTYMVKDINVGPGYSFDGQANIYQNHDNVANDKCYAVLNGFMYFVANDGTDYSIWRTDGTESGTIKLISGPDLNFQTRIITAANNKIFFRTSTNSLTDVRMWSTDGTQAGTIDLGIPEMSSGDQFKRHIIYNNSLYFTVSLSSGTIALMKSDGTVAGTSIVKSDFTTYNHFASLYPCGNFIYFSVGWQSMPGQELWRTDGTQNGTVQLGDLSTTVWDFFYNCDVCHQNNLLYLKRNDDNKIWYVNGNSTDVESYLTTSITNAVPFAVQSPYRIQKLYQSGFGLFFTANSELGGHELYFTDFDITLDTPDFNNNDQIKSNVIVYPNPTKNIINIKTHNGEEVTKVKVYDLLGKQVYTSTNNVEHNLSNLNDGIYIVKVFTDKSNYSSKLVIKK